MSRSDSPAEVTRSPLLGEHNEEILREVLKFDDRKIAEFMTSGALTAAGLPSALAVAATLTQRLVTTWLPTLPGWFALRALQRADDL